MRDHQHVVPAPFGRSIEDDHQEWLASGDPCVMCGERRVFRTTWLYNGEPVADGFKPSQRVIDSFELPPGVGWDGALPTDLAAWKLAQYRYDRKVGR